MKRSTLPLPRYVLRKPIKSGGYAYYFNAPIWARKAGCPVRNEPLGTDYGLAVQRAETVLLPAFDSWRCGGKPDIRGIAAAPGTLDWVFAEYRADRRYTKLDPKTRRNHEVGFQLVGGYVLKDGRRLGQAQLTAITTAVTDAIYERIKVVVETDEQGNTIEREPIMR
jgi:hypothetical protein